MYISKEQIVHGITQFFTKELCEKATGVNKFSMYFLLPSVPNMTREYLKKISESVLGAELFNSEEYLNVDEAYSRATAAMQHCGFIDVAGVRFKQEDLDMLLDYFKRG